MVNQITNIRKITVSAILTAISIIIPLWMPFKLPLPQPFSATVASHVPGILAMFISPFTVVCTSVGSAIGFLTVLGPTVALRAFSHIIFGLVGYFLLRKNFNVFLVIIITMLLHAASEVVVVMVYAGKAWSAAWLPVGVVAMTHHCIDFIITLLIIKGLKAAKILNINVKYGL